MNKAGCYDVVLEPTLQQLNDVMLPSGSKTLCQLEESQETMRQSLCRCLDLRNAKIPVKQNLLYTADHYENLKKREHDERVMDTFKKASVTHIVFNTTIGMVKEADKLLKRLAEKLAIQGSMPHSKMAFFVKKTS